MIYLDNSATTKPRQEVLDTFVQVNERFYANPASLHTMGNEAEDLLEQAREQVRNLLYMDRVIFTSGGTESNNLAIAGTAKAYKHRGRHIISAPTEHPSVLNTLLALEKEGFEVTYLTVDQSGKINLNELKNSLRKDTILVTLMHVNNEIGTIHPIGEISRLLKPTRTFFHTDAVQSAGKVPFDKDAMPDLLSFSAHKVHGLKGSGVLAVNRGDVQPLFYGGGQEAGLRSGTVSVPHAAALAKALRMTRTNANYPKWNKDLRTFFSQFPDVYTISPEDGASHILSIALKGIRGEVLVSALQQESVIVSTSSACSSKSQDTSHVIEAIGVPRAYKEGVIRISFGEFTEKHEIEAFKAAFTKAVRLIKGDKTK